MAEGEDHERPLTLLIRNLPQDASVDEAFEMYLENVTDEDRISVEYSDALNEALVMFDNLSIDSADVKDRIRQKAFLGSMLQVEDALPNNRVWVTNLKPDIDKETLELYFEQKKLNPDGGSVEVDYDPSNHVAIVNYSDASAVEIVLATDRSKTQMLGPNVVIEHCRFFDSLSTLAESVGTEEPCMPDEEEDVSGGCRAEGDETIASSDEADKRQVNQGQGRGRNNRPGGRRGWRRGGRQGRGGFVSDGQRIYERRDSESSQHSEPPPYGERSMHYDQGGALRGNRRPGRGRGAMGDARRPRYLRDRRPQSASRNEYSADQVVIDAGNRDSAPRGYGNRRGDHPHYPPRRGSRGDGGQSRGQGRGAGMYQRANSIPSLFDQPLSLPTGSFDSAELIHKEIEVQREVGTEKCHLLTTMIRDVKRHGCEARIDMRRHCVTLSGPSAAVTAAAETLYSQLLTMHSIELEFPARFAQLLATPRGHSWVVNFFKSTKLRAIYYTNEESVPSLVASDEYVANSAKVLLMGKIKSVEIPYAKWHKTYLQSDTWTGFVDSAEKTWLLNIEVTLGNVIRIIGIEDDVYVAADSTRSQLSGLEKPTKGQSGSSSKQEQTPRPDELPGDQLLCQHPAALDSVEISKVCPICGVTFPQSLITDHVNLCSSSKVCPICSKAFPSSTPVSLFSIHVNEHFGDSDLV